MMPPQQGAWGQQQQARPVNYDFQFRSEFCFFSSSSCYFIRCFWLFFYDLILYSFLFFFLHTDNNNNNP
jgi:hypothetical protein